MKKATFLLALGLIFLPSIVSAAWWNPSTWKKSDKATTTPNTEQTTSSEAYVPPSTNELLRRIAELEDKLGEAQANLKKLTGTVKPESKAVDEAIKKASAKVVVSEPVTVVSNGLSQSDIVAKVKPAIVLVETATSSSSGIIIDSQGRILTSAHAVWLETDDNHVVGTNNTAIVTLSNGLKKEAVVIGLDEATNLAVLQLVSKSSSLYLKLNYDAGVTVGDKVYVFNTSAAKAKNGSNIASGSVVKKTSAVIEINTEEKPYDIGGAVVNSNGAFIGIQNPSTCKVLEEGRVCLKYTVTVDDKISARLPKLLLGMKLYKNKADSTGEEKLIGGKLEGMYKIASEYGAIDSAYEYVTGSNSFDYFNDRLSEDERGKITLLYLRKLSLSANNIFKAYESLKSQAYDLHVFFINEEVAISTLSSYQKSILTEINDFNEAKIKEYTAKVTEWSKKKNDFDARIADPSNTNHDYLMVQGAQIETAVGVLKAEKKKIKERYSGENVEIF